MTEKILTFALISIFSASLLFAADQDPSKPKPEDQKFLDNIVSILEALDGKFEYKEEGPFLKTKTGFKRAGVTVFSGDDSAFVHLGNIIDKYPDTAHKVITTLVDCIDSVKPTRATYKDKPVSLGIMCYEALRNICYYEATDKEGSITTWEGIVLPGATRGDLGAAKKAWEKIVKERSYILL
ncbi:MAG: hypothetical protein ABSA46_18990 [Thermodesulfovibrionales bacterium]|jgi:hypothetical protein